MQVFLSYRRSDVGLYLIPEFTRVLAERAHTKAVTKDDAAPRRESIEASDRFVLLIGPKWRPEKLAEDDDEVRLELETALALGKPIVPVLIGSRGVLDQEELPTEFQFLTGINAGAISAPPGHEHDIERVARHFLAEQFRLHTKRLWSTRTDGGCVFAPTGELLTGERDLGVRVLDPRTGEPMREVETELSATLAVSPDGTILATAGLGRKVSLSDLATGQRRRELRTGVKEGVWRLSFSPDGRWLAVAGGGTTIEVFDIGTGKRAHRLQGHEDSPTASRFMPSQIKTCAFAASGTLVTVGDDSTARLWDPEQSFDEILKVAVDGASAGALSPDGSFLVVGSSDSLVRVFDRDGLQLHVLEGHRLEIDHVAFSPTRRLVATQATDGVILWNAEAGIKVAELSAPAEDPGMLADGCAFSPDGTLIAAASDFGLWVDEISDP